MVEPTIFLDEGHQKIWQVLMALPEFVNFKVQQNVDCRLPVQIRGKLHIVLTPSMFGFAELLDIRADGFCGHELTLSV